MLQLVACHYFSPENSSTKLNKMSDKEKAIVEVKDKKKGKEKEKDKKKKKKSKEIIEVTSWDCVAKPNKQLAKKGSSIKTKSQYQIEKIELSGKKGPWIAKGHAHEVTRPLERAVEEGKVGTKQVRISQKVSKLREQAEKKQAKSKKKAVEAAEIVEGAVKVELPTKPEFGGKASVSVWVSSSESVNEIVTKILSKLKIQGSPDDYLLCTLNNRALTSTATLEYVRRVDSNWVLRLMATEDEVNAGFEGMSVLEERYGIGILNSYEEVAIRQKVCAREVLSLNMNEKQNRYRIFDPVRYKGKTKKCLVMVQEKSSTSCRIAGAIEKTRAINPFAHDAIGRSGDMRIEFRHPETKEVMFYARNDLKRGGKAFASVFKGFLKPNARL